MVQQFLLEYADTIIVIIIVFITAKILIHILDRIADRIYREEPLKPQLKTIISAVVYFLALTVSLAHLGLTTWLYPLLTSAGIIGIIIGVSAQASLSNVIAGIILLADKPFEPGDYISVVTLDKPFTGKVLSMGFRSTKLKSFEENIVVIPNAVISSTIIVNLSAEDKHLRVSILFPMKKDRIKKSLKILEEIGKQFERDHAPQLLLKDVLDNKATIELRVLIAGVESRDAIISQINQQYLDLFDEN